MPSALRPCDAQGLLHGLLGKGRLCLSAWSQCQEGCYGLCVSGNELGRWKVCFEFCDICFSLIQPTASPAGTGAGPGRLLPTSGLLVSQVYTKQALLQNDVLGDFILPWQRHLSNQGNSLEALENIAGGFGHKHTWAPFPASCVPAIRLLNCPLPQLPHLYSGDSSTHFQDCSWAMSRAWGTVVPGSEWMGLPPSCHSQKPGHT